MGRDHLVGEGPDAGLAPADLGREPGHGPHPMIQRRPGRAAEFDRGQPGGGDQRQLSQGLGVDDVGDIGTSGPGFATIFAVAMGKGWVESC
jgi:hypothetical protein